MGLIGAPMGLIGACISVLTKRLPSKKKGAYQAHGPWHRDRHGLRGTAQSIAARGGSRTRAALMLLRPAPCHVRNTPTTCLRVPVTLAAAPCCAFDLCSFLQRALLATRRQHGVQVQEQLCRRALQGATVIVGRAQAVVSGLAVSTEIVGRFQVSVLGSKLPNYIVIVVGMMTRSPFTVAMST